jgi:hypothetical protein
MVIVTGFGLAVNIDHADRLVNAGAVDKLPQERIAAVIFGNHLIAVVGVLGGDSGTAINGLGDSPAGIVIDVFGDGGTVILDLDKPVKDVIDIIIRAVIGQIAVLS